MPWHQYKELPELVGQDTVLTAGNEGTQLCNVLQLSSLNRTASFFSHLFFLAPFTAGLDSWTWDALGCRRGRNWWSCHPKHFRRGCMRCLFLCLRFKFWNFKLFDFLIINCNGQRDNGRSWNRFDLSRKKPELHSEPKITASESSLCVSWGFISIKKCTRGAGQGGVSPLEGEGWGTALSLGLYLQMSFAAELPSELNQPRALGPCWDLDLVYLKNATSWSMTETGDC